MSSSIHFGTCSWNYNSWIGLVYSGKCNRAADYLYEYAQKYDTVEVDSWFYKIPNPYEAGEYLAASGDKLTFSCKLFNGITLTHYRSKTGNRSLEKNDDFLSVDLFKRFVDSIWEMHSRTRLVSIEMEFEYLNRQKMPSLDAFLKHLDTFFESIEHDVPLAVETRNGNYLHEEYFILLKKWNVSHVFSEKMYLPHIYDVYEKYGDLLNDKVIFRLLGGDRKKIEATTKGKWDKLVDEKPDLPQIVEMLKALKDGGKSVYVYVNNHYEGSAPLTIRKLHEKIS